MFAVQSLLLLSFLLILEYCLPQIKLSCSSYWSDRPSRLPILHHSQLKRLAISVVCVCYSCISWLYLYWFFYFDLSADLSYKHARIAARSSSVLLLSISYFYNFVSTFISVALFYSRRPFDILSISLIISVMLWPIYFHKPQILPSS